MPRSMRHLLLKILDSFKADALAQYVIGFVPDSNASPKRHNLEVRVAKKSSGSVEGASAGRFTDPGQGARRH